MFAYMDGIVAEKSATEIILEVNGIGYSIQCSMNTLGNTPSKGEPMRCYTYLAVREDALDLFGFATKAEKAMFQRLCTVTGIGPKTALGILGSMPLQDLGLAIAMEDITALSRAPGVGKKTAQRIALELKDKMAQTDLEGIPLAAEMTQSAPGEGAGLNDALLALQSLGYSGQEAARALQKVKGQSEETDELIRLALRAMAGSN